MPESELLTVPSGEISLRSDGLGDAPVDLILAPGAGAGMDHSFMATVATAIAAQGFRVWRFNFLYQERGRKSPDKNQVLEETYRAIVDHVGDRGAETVVAGGKSMGGRIASQIAASGAPIDGLVFHGYPLHPPGRPDRMRDAHLRDITVPMLFVEGTRDPFCPLETLEKVRADLSAPNDLVVIDGGDHSFKLRASSGRTTKEAIETVVQATADWIRRRYL
ncbi:MAG TPA: alpha/beta fold hydrolase [Actinomycetota bacterium]|nr:alpha/beta fold hydrolase [Actinomycetota bacterium]